MNLVIALLSTHGFITAERIRASVAGYAESPSDEAFSRMFERDKNELRDLGIPLETGRVSSFDPAEGYRINRNAYALPDIELTAQEAAAVAVAAQLWESPELMADNRIPSTSSEPRSPDGPEAVVIATAASASTSTPAARSFSSAPWVAVISSGDSHSAAATATAAASSAVRSMSGNA